MVQIILLIFIIAVVIFIWMKNKQDNRNIDRHNRMVDKQEELLRMLKEKEKNETDEN